GRPSKSRWPRTRWREDRQASAGGRVGRAFRLLHRSRRQPVEGRVERLTLLRINPRTRGSCLGRDPDAPPGHPGQSRPGRHGRVHNVPVTFAIDGDTWYSPSDAGSRPAQRLRHLSRDPRVTIIIDVYDEDWARVWWVRLPGQ